MICYEDIYDILQQKSWYWFTYDFNTEGEIVIIKTEEIIESKNFKSLVQDIIKYCNKEL